MRIIYNSKKMKTCTKKQSEVQKKRILYLRDMYGQLEARGLQQLASTIHHFWKCSSGELRSCPNPCDAMTQCSEIDNTKTGICIQQDITKSQSRPVFNIYTSFMLSEQFNIF